MGTKIRITVGSVTVEGELFDSACAGAIAGKLPIRTRPNQWGDEFYFAIPVAMDRDETATTKVKVGDIGYWPPGNALAIFFGPTPLSKGADPVPASEVNLVGIIREDARALTKARGATGITIERID